jgi:predicted AAA+ superfamily ATPase
MADLESLIEKAESLIVRLEAFFPPVANDTDWNALAWRWQVKQGRAYLKAVNHPHHIVLDAVCNVDKQKSEIVRNTAQFISGFPANNVLLTGARGTGKSTLVKALLSEFSEDGLRLVEVEKENLVDLPEIVEMLRNRPEYFIIFCDDLSFEATEAGYKSLKVVLDGSISAASDNVLIYATSNRRHLMPEFMAENLQTQYVGDEIRPGDTTEEKISLSERFGLWLSFYAFDQEEYLKVAEYWLMHFGRSVMTSEIRQAALLFSLTRGARSGRVAYQFARDYVGQLALKDASK